MKKLILLLLLALASGRAMADWFDVAETGEIMTYVDSATIRKQGDKVRMWSLNDYGNIQTITGDSFQSMLFLAEYDCKLAKYKTLQLSSHMGNMGDGNLVIEDEGELFWRRVRPGTVAAALLKFACKKGNRIELNY